MWCPECYISSNEINFHVRSKPGLKDEDERFRGAWEKDEDQSQYHMARKGDNLITPFECDLCVLIKLKGRYSNSKLEADRKLAACIRRMNLDAFWSRAPATVSNDWRLAQNLVNMPKGIGLEGPFVSYGPMPSYDHCGYQIAVTMLLMSTKPGRYDKTYLQFDTIRHLRSCFSNFEKASSNHALDHLTSGNDESQTSLTSSLWFRRFYAGCKARMGQINKPNLALSTNLITFLLERILKEHRVSNSAKIKFDLIIFGAYVVISYVISLRGSEGLMVDLTAINRELNSKREHCTIGLKGKVKGEYVDRNHLFPCVNVTVSGVNVKQWLLMLSTCHKMAGRKGGPAVTDWNGEILSISNLDSKLHLFLSQMFEDNEEFPQEIKTTEDIYERFSVFRSMRRASATRAINRKVSSNDIDVVNRWKSAEAAKGKRPNRPMRQHYAEVSELKEPFLRYTYQM